MDYCELNLNIIADKLVMDFNNGLIDKYPYIERMGLIYQNLSLFSKRLKSSLIKKIEVIEEGIIFHFKNGLKLYNSKIETLSVPSHILSLGFYEEEENIIYKLISEKDVIFDIGANVGWYALNIANKFQKVKIYAFEPAMNTFNSLKYNIEINGLGENISLQNIGVSDTNGFFNLYFPQDESALTSMENIYGKNVEEIMLEFKTLDSFVANNNIKNIDFIKCDVEGAELKVINGAYNTISKHLPIIFLEIYEGWTLRFSYSPQEIINIMDELGYSCFLLINGSLRKITDYNKEAQYCNENNNNFFFFHNIKHSSQIENIHTLT